MIITIDQVLSRNFKIVKTKFESSIYRQKKIELKYLKIQKGVSRVASHINFLAEIIFKINWIGLITTHYFVKSPNI